ncbi:acyl-CoA dehydrogenase family protein [Minwuia thermotolerans]|uniref:Acyl-CoA dehydrogenase n=1 Tax=Minwuia thermotolerans TaxID=2056226 RepID=A0A2M9G5R8_9PROT|nr:acyl-CoA dehydrogenase family protein [Minwuia thermotolerans]PJK31016.1 acyl-CoA dehydrogenase [Minwuia thermotolerans]
MNNAIPNEAAAPAFDLSEEQRTLLDTADRYAREQIYPLAARMDNEEWWPDAEFRALGEVGFLGVTAPPELGGAGLDVFGSGLLLQAISRWNPAFGLAWVAHDNLCMNNILRNGNEDIRKRYVPGLADGSLIGALGLTEPGAGSDALGSMRTTARRDGDDYILNGSKLYITNGPVADILLVYAKTNPEAGAKGISAFVIEKDMPGFKVAQKLIKMGFRGSQTGELVFEDCRVPAANMVGEENKGHVVVMSGLDLERAMISPICLGICERAYELTVDYARERKQFGQPISSFQMVQSHIADMYVMLEAVRLFTYKGLAAVNDLAEGEGGRGDVHKITAASVMYTANTMNRLLDLAVQVHGGTGYIWESEINRLFRHTKLLEIGAGTTEVRKMIIAGEIFR